MSSKDYDAVCGLINHLALTNEDPNWEMIEGVLNDISDYISDLPLKLLTNLVCRTLTEYHSIDVVSMRSEIEKRLTDIQADAVKELFMNISTATQYMNCNPLQTCQYLRKSYRVQTFTDVLADSVQKFKDTEDPLTVLNYITEQCSQIFKDPGEVRSVASDMPDVMALIYANMNNEIHSMTTGFNQLDNLIGYFGGEQYIILAGRPGTGKTTFAAQIGCYVAGNYGNVLMFSQEMARFDVSKRLVSAESGINYKNLYFAGNEKLNQTQMTYVSEANYTLEKTDAGTKFYIADKPYNVIELCATARDFNRHHPLSLIIIDYLTLTETSEKTAYDKATAISEAFRKLTKELKVPVLCLSQMNRDYEKRAARSPQNSDLRDSGKIEQDAHLIMFLSPSSGPKGANLPDSVKLSVTKNRSGKCGEVPFNFFKDTCRFEEISLYGNHGTQN